MPRPPRLPRHLLPLLVLLAPLLLLAACSSLPSGLPVPPVPPRDPLVDIVHYDIAVDIDHAANHVNGCVTVQFRALPGRPADTLLLDAVEMQISDVSDRQGRQLAFDQRDNQLLIHLAERLPPGADDEVSVTYSCYPRRGLYIIAPSASDPGRPWQLWTQGESHETRYWVPCWDQPNDRATLTLHATVDKSFLTMSSGQRISSVVDEKTGRRTDTWQMDTPHVSYLITLLAGQLAQGEIPGGPVPLPVIAQTDALPHALQNFAATPDILATFAQFTGRAYPYPKYAQSCIKEFVAGGQENISATTLLHETIHDPADDPQASSEDLISHEASHQWFGDLITCRDWDDLWLNEGFATYCEVYYGGHRHGQDHLRAEWQSAQRAYVGEERQHSHPIVWHDYQDPDAAFDTHAYQGAGARLHLLEELLGTETFQRGVQLYVHRRENTVVETADFEHDMEEASGRDLAQFFEEWFYGAGFPEFEARPVRRAPADAAASPGAAEDPRLADTLLVEQVQGRHGGREVFHLSVTVTWSRGGREHSQRFDIADRVQSLPLEGQGDLDWVRFDGTTVVPGTIQLQQTEAMWASQLRGASDGVTRLVAAQWFEQHGGGGHGRGGHGRHGGQAGGADGAGGEAAGEGSGPDAHSVSQLVEAAQEDPFVDVRTHSLAALAGVKDPRLPQVFEAALKDKDPRVREAAAAGLGQQGGDDVLPALLAAASDDNALVAAAALGALVDRKFPGAFKLCTDTARRSDRYRLDAAIVRAVARIEDEPGVQPFLLGAARLDPVPRVRAAAIDELSRQPDPDGVIFRALGELLNDASYQVRGPAARALHALQPEAAEPLLLARRAIEIDPTVIQSIDTALAGQDGS